MTLSLHGPPVFPDRFAVEWGHDKYGTFQSFAVGKVMQRMRWIPPGSFLMGSPESEVGRYDDEFQHRVELTQGFWLADTPVTQALWEAVMGTNPSRFNGPERPVDSVSWDDCQVFLVRLGQRIPWLEARLPTEAEWEYACRAGTKTATWVDELEHNDQIEPLLLRSIAWYCENAAEMTHPVAQKHANPWGLYDMLGNVWEWCADWYAPYDINTLLDTGGPPRGIEWVLRGSSWGSVAKSVRAAIRFASPSNDCSGSLGFRLAHSPSRRDG